MNARDPLTLDAIARDVDARVAALQWPQVEAELDAQGAAVLPRLITPDECGALAALYDNDDAFRSRVVMARHGFGQGEYRYFRYPLPPLIGAFRRAVYPHLVPLANRWHEAMGLATRFPPGHEAWIQHCHAIGQTRPTPLLLRYGPGDYNCLHQDVYGDAVFPLQLVLLLSQPGRDFDGGEFAMTEQRPRMQSRAMVLPLQQGDGALIAVRHRPVRGARGFYRVNLRHGVATVRSGRRFTAGIIFHDAA